MSQFAEQLRELRQLPESAVDSEVFVTRVMAACDAETPAASSRRPVIWLAATTLLAAAAALALVHHHQSVPRPHAGVVAARGVTPTRVSATVQAFVGRAALGQAAALLEGAELGPGDGILVRYSNPGESRAFLMVFALDAAREVHWLHPAYLDAKSDPSSLELRPGVSEQTLDEVAEPENPAPGALEVYALLSEAPLTVKAIEARLAARPGPVHALFPEAEVEEWRCTWRAP
jgi:hypothetical protein